MIDERFEQLDMSQVPRSTLERVFDLVARARYFTMPEGVDSNFMIVQAADYHQVVNVVKAAIDRHCPAVACVGVRQFKRGELAACVMELRNQGLNAAEIAARLGVERYVNSKGKPYTESAIYASITAGKRASQKEAACL